jgi:outer membrane protein
MRFRPLLVVCILGLLAPLESFGADLKLGFIDVKRVLKESPQAEDGERNLEKEFGPRDRALVAMQKTLKQQEDKLSRDADIMSETARGKLDRDVRHQRRELRRSREELQEDFNIRRNEILAQLQRQADEAIQTLAKRANYDLVLSDGVMYAGKRVDITDEVLEQMRVDYKREQNRKSAGGN